MTAVLFTEQGFQIPNEIAARWRAAYPAMNVALEIRRAHEWILANPQRKKRNWHRFLLNWLNRSQRYLARRGRPELTLEERKERTMEQLRQMRTEGRL